MKSRDPRSGVLERAKRIVVKVGSSLLIGSDGAPARAWLAALARDVADLRARGKDLIVVSSGAVVLGRSRLGLKGPLKLEEKQAAAAAGQADLVHAYERAFRPHGVNVAQVLLTLQDSDDRRRYLNARATLNTLIDLGAVPLVNENDTVATAEIRYGDNDRLAAHAAQMAGADLLILLSDVDGLYTGDPRVESTASHVPLVARVTQEIEAMAGGADPCVGVGSGGMRTKLEAARIAGGSGCATVISLGSVDRPLASLETGARATLLQAATTPVKARKQWISGRLSPAGVVTIDAGAVSALGRGGSLLPAGVTKVAGEFGRGDAIRIEGPGGASVGQGLAAYDANEIIRLKGRRSEDMEDILGYRRGPEIIHRDDMALVETGSARGAGSDE